MHFKSYLHAVFSCQRPCLFPIGKQTVVPLVIQHFQKIIQPGAGHPVRVLGSVGIAGAAGKSYYFFYAQLTGQPARESIDDYC